MKKNAAKPRERSKEKSKQAFLDAVGKILKTKGYQALKVNDIAATAGLDKKLIYKYFGGTDQLMDEYVRSQDFWSNVKSDHPAGEITDGGRSFSKEMLLLQFDYVFKNKELQKVLLWRLSEQRKSLKKLTAEQESNGELLFQGITDPHFGEKAEDFRAVMAILVSGVYYLNLYAAVNGSVFCGLDLKSAEGRAKIGEALSFLVDVVYEKK
ncbi:MAG: TetR/AcrR family transcriptional regulator [Chitinophagaceae bacterium]